MVTPTQAMTLQEWYVGIASLICTVAMAADVFQGFRHRKLWFPCRFFTIDATSTQVITITMKLLMDITDEWPWMVKFFGFVFLFTMLANFLPSLGGMDNKELFTNITALGILIITTIIKFSIQNAPHTYGEIGSTVLEMSIIIFFLVWPFCIALLVPTSKRVLEVQYQKFHKLDLNRQEQKFSSKELTHHVKKYWMMAETGDPQFVLACSPFCSASGLVCLIFATMSLILLIDMLVDPSLVWDVRSTYGVQSDHKSSINVISTVQYFGIVVGSIAPIFRCITTATYFNPTIAWSIRRINMFRVEKHWTQRLQQWKDIYIASYIPGRHCKIVFNCVKNMILNICMALQITLVVICKMICFVPTCVMLSLFSCCHYCNLIRFQKDSDASNNNVRSEIEGYKGCVLQIEDETELTDRTLRNMLRSITEHLQKSEKEQPQNLMKFLEKSTILSGGVLEFHNNQALPFCQGDEKTCWSLVAVTLTTIAIAVPNIANGHVDELVATMNEGLKFVRHIEETLYATDELVKARKTARCMWTEVEVYRKWLDIKLQCQARNGKPSREILRWLGGEAGKIVRKKDSKEKSVDDSFNKKLIAASSMQRISQTILHHYGQGYWQTDAELFGWISTVTADLLWACFTNLPRVIARKCHQDAIEKRGESIWTAARLLGESKWILNVLENSQFQDLDQESMAYIDKWQAPPKSQTPTNCCASSAGIQPAPNESVILPVM